MYLNPGDDIAAVTSAPKSAPAPKAKVTETATAGSAAPTKAETPESKVTTDDDLDSFLDDLNI